MKKKFSPQDYTIVIVEDSQVQAEFLRRLLSGAGYLVAVAKDGLEGLRMIESSPPSLVISDIAMPNLNGYELCAKIRSNPKIRNIPLILLTGLSSVKDLVRGLNSGADHYFNKPYDSDSLLDRIRLVLEGNTNFDEPLINFNLPLDGEKLDISARPQQMIRLLVFNYMNSVEQNTKLQSAKEKISELNSQLLKESDLKNAQMLLQDRNLAVEKANNLENTTFYLKDLHTNLIDAVAAIAATSEIRDPYTSGHQRRVAALAVAIAKHMSFDDDFIEGLKIIGVIHDIGKIRVPSEILSKPGKLLDSEIALIREHPNAGYDILKGINFPWPIAIAVAQHHERIDGSGYPKGLKGTEIIIQAKIIAVADTIEAISSHRPYRVALGIKAACDEIRAGRGTKYDPEIVDACIAVIDAGLWAPSE
jgi:response regulator RpfG family c-di-GMP phosphodiesterase